MTQEDKDLLLRDLSARFPYGVIIRVPSKESSFDKRLQFSDIEYYFSRFDDEEKDTPKPYLRPMSSMTEEEIIELLKIDGKRGIFSSRHLTWYLDGEVADFLNANHFDYRGLIERGLALEAPEGMYKTWNSLRGNLKEDNQGNIVGGLKL